MPGSALWGFDEALRVFEIHRNQVGVLVFVAEALSRRRLSHRITMIIANSMIRSYKISLVNSYGNTQCYIPGKRFSFLYAGRTNSYVR